MRPKVLAVTPLFVVADLQRSLDFYCQKLGFREPGVWGEPPCFGMCNRDLFDLMLSIARKPDEVRPNGPHGVWDMYIKVTDLAAEMAAFRQAALLYEHRPDKTFYNMIETEVVDPDGYRICFGQEVD